MSEAIVVEPTAPLVLGGHGSGVTTKPVSLPGCKFVPF